MSIVISTDKWDIPMYGHDVFPPITYIVGEQLGNRVIEELRIENCEESQLRLNSAGGKITRKTRQKDRLSCVRWQPEKHRRVITSSTTSGYSWNVIGWRGSILCPIALHINDVISSEASGDYLERSCRKNRIKSATLVAVDRKDGWHFF